MDTGKPKLVLVTAFDPFGGEGVNASQRVLEALPDRPEGLVLAKLLLPTTFAGAPELAICRAQELRPSAILCLGQAAGRTAVTPERAALNIMDARIPDNAGAQPVDVPIDPAGPAAYFSTLPLRRMVEAVRGTGTPAQLSNTAGTFVCNCLMYRMLRYVSGLPEKVPCGFVHVPALPEQGGPGLPLADLVRGVTAALGTLA
jgi:pyroglutamyl-peptidase